RDAFAGLAGGRLGRRAATSAATATAPSGEAQGTPVIHFGVTRAVAPRPSGRIPAPGAVPVVSCPTPGAPPSPDRHRTPPRPTRRVS
ncbi:hypothetical protein R6V09_38560, partial [Streptomyces sp. W16]|nr:hypothetical protein [Streptomyces sp. W16]